jgi:hypothetical protein
LLGQLGLLVMENSGRDMESFGRGDSFVWGPVD